MSHADLARRVELACLLEAAARKPGNVHPWAAFEDLRFEDFVQAAAAIAPVLAETRGLGLGRAILEAVRATQQSVATNANLGIILLLAPLCAVPDDMPTELGVGDVLRGTTVDDASLVYEAIRLARPGGLGTAAEQDVAEPPTCTLLQAMQLAADRDLVARQYARGFEDVFWLAARLDVTALRQAGRTPNWDWTVIDGYLQQLARRPDTLISRKCGVAVAEAASRRALAVVAEELPKELLESPRVAELDGWLRGDGHQRNPGATADLVAAGAFLALSRVRSADLPEIQQVLGWARVTR